MYSEYRIYLFIKQVFCSIVLVIKHSYAVSEGFHFNGVKVE